VHIKFHDKMAKNIIFFCAHNDDSVISAGGTIAKYSKEGYKINVFVFSYGELSHPHLKSEVIIKERVKESKKSDEILGCNSVYLGLSEGKFLESKEKLKKKIKEIIREKTPEKIFTHVPDDPHPDHRTVYSIVTGVYDSLDQKIKEKCGLYTFAVWNLFNMQKRNAPQLIIDTSQTFVAKIKAIKMHKSQRLAVIFLIFSVYFKAICNGMKNNIAYAEVFYKER